MPRENPILNKSELFALMVIEIYKELIAKNEFVMSKQLLRSGTGIGALIAESQHAESKKDFIHKLAIAQKECGETMYWIKLLYKSDFMEQKEFDQLNANCVELMKLLGSIILTSKRNLAA